MLVNDFLRVTCQFDVPHASNPCVNVWDFKLESTDNPITLSADGPAFVESFIDRYYIPIANQISSQVTMTQISLRAWATPDDGYDQVGIIFVGAGAGVMLPPANTMAIRLVRSNYAMRNGRKAFPGPVTGMLNADGTMTDAVKASVNTVTAAWLATDFTVEFSGADAIFGEYIVRVPTTSGTNPTVVSFVSGYGTPYFGTQNSRK